MSESGGGGKSGRRGRKVRVDFRHNIGKAVRRKQRWTQAYRAEQDQVADAEGHESVRAKGRLSRRRTIVEDAPPTDRSAWREGLVVAMRGAAAHVDAAGVRWRCSVRRVLRSRLIAERHPVAVGDRVWFMPSEVRGTEQALAEGDAEPEGVIEEVAPRRTTLVRQYADRVHVIAANVDQAIIAASVDDPPLRPHLIDRFLVAAHQGELRPVICINKIDLELDEEGRAILDDIVGRYRSLRYTVLLTSATTGQGIDAFRDVMTDRCSVVMGMSGVGKSSLLNAADPGLSLRVGNLSGWSRRGQHTTSTAELIRLAFGGYVVDTPGIRQFGLADVDATELEAYFPEFVDRVAGCRFPDCRHLNEDGCAIRAAVRIGEIHPQRYDSYARMVTQRMSKPRSAKPD